MRRVIPCLDVRDGRVVKGVRFEALRDAGDPVEQAALYAREGADEICFLDISATLQDRSPLLHAIEACASQVFVPLTVGGGVRSVEDARDLLLAGADKVGVNSAAVADPALLSRMAERFGAQCVVLAVDARRTEGGYHVFTHAGQRDTGLDVVAWCRDAVARGAGEILLTSIDRDGTQSGYDLDLLRVVREAVNVPVVASGGAGKASDFAEALSAGADAVLAASLFHFKTLSIREVKDACAKAGLPMREVPA